MKQLTLLLAIVAMLGTAETSEATSISLPSCVIDHPIFSLQAKRRIKPRLKSSKWATYQYTLYDEEFELELPQRYEFSDNDGVLWIQFEKSKETYIVTVTPLDGEELSAEDVYDAISREGEKLLAQYGGEIGEPNVYDRGDLEIVDVLTQIPIQGGSVYLRTACYISENSLYWLSVTYINKPSGNVDRFFNSFNLVD
jgi:hypothetical protein